MSRGAAIDEIATMIDEMNTELLEVVNALMTEVEKSDSRQHAVLLNHLHEILVNYKPMQVNPNDQHQLFSSATETQTAVGVVAGQMP